MSIERPWPYEEDDYMELGDTDIIPVKDGWFLDKRTGYTVSPSGVIYDRDGEVIGERRINEWPDDEYLPEQDDEDDYDDWDE